MTSRNPVPKNETILIVGAGIFGLSTALELKKRGYQHVTVIDRYLPPVVDGSSVDISRVIRIDYADPLYAQMAREAHKGWTSEFEKHYYPSGFVMLAKQPGHPYLERTKGTSESLGATLEEFKDAKAVLTRYPEIQARLEGLKAYVNKDGGWADAENAVRQLSIQCSLAGVSFIVGPRGRAISLRYDGNRVVGVNVAEGEPILAAQVVLATGAWTNRLIQIEHAVSASGQPVGFIHLTPQESKGLQQMPVIINLSTGVFVFPPTPGTNILKIARHCYGFATQVAVEGQDYLVSSPKRDSSGVEKSYLPEDAEVALREGLRDLMPAFAQHKWTSRRLCWYSDTPEGDFVVDYHPRIEGLFFAAGGAGHYASSEEINAYLKGVARYFNLDPFITYNSKVKLARWSANTSTWTIEVENGPCVESEILINACGILNDPRMPDIEGLSTFAGPLLHTAAWDSSVDLRNKKIGVIGLEQARFNFFLRSSP
ncbi:sarcosine oxidase [Purpureocillium lilacinum]|uniref:Sarcosine oxidase n=1 Tax=Purpureocillium lilacinum TaxID=33203 RepID=A0A179GH48_PURLI|nr:sarcosine oxidase [Purpureocillium lilacinum]